MLSYYIIIVFIKHSFFQTKWNQDFFALATAEDHIKINAQ